MGNEKSKQCFERERKGESGKTHLRPCGAQYVIGGNRREKSEKNGEEKEKQKMCGFFSSKQKTTPIKVEREEKFKIFNRSTGYGHMGRRRRGKNQAFF